MEQYKKEDVIAELQKVVDAIPPRNYKRDNDTALIVSIDGELHVVTYGMLRRREVVYREGKMMWND